MTRERKQAFIADLENMEAGMERTAERSDIWQDRLVYALCKAVWHILTFLMLKFGKEE
ncbi:MAG: hypothetical protein II008_00985 [Oscillospiraceae bacterium]|nr:hypothetical protein [Oscillospiraceae bacterium]